MQTQRVVIVGASDQKHRYAYKALQALAAAGHEVVLVHPNLQQIEGHPVVRDLSYVEGKVDTVTMYVNATISAQMTSALRQLQPRRVIFNPGSENAALENELSSLGIQVQQACTLVLLSLHQFDLA